MIKLVILILGLTFTSCSTAKVNSSVYSVGKEYFYRVEKLDSANRVQYFDTLVMRIESSGFLRLFHQKKAFWYSISSANKNENWRGITDDGESLEIQVPIHLIELSKLTIAPYPKIMIPPKEGYKISSTHSFINGYGDQTGKTIQQEISIGQKENCSVLGEKKECWRIEGQNTSLIQKEGVYKMTALFENSTGFVEWKYTYPNASTVIFKLVEIK